MILKYSVISFISSIITVIPVYYFFPEIIQWGLMKLKIIDIGNIDLLKKIISSESEITALKNQLIKLNEEKNLLESEISKSRAERDGVLKIMNDLSNHMLKKIIRILFRIKLAKCFIKR